MSDRTDETQMEILDSSGQTVFSGTDKDFSRVTKRLTEALERPEEFQIPAKADFAGKDFLAAPALQEVGLRLIEHFENDFAHLNDANIVYLWKEKGGDSGGMATLGKCIRPTGLASYFAADEDESAAVNYVIWAAADHLRENRASVRTVHALIFHELLHTRWEDGKLIVRSHEFEGFAREIEEFGMWTNSIKRIAEACETVKDVQQGLFTNVG